MHLGITIFLTLTEKAEKWFFLGNLKKKKLVKGFFKILVFFALF